MNKKYITIVLVLLILVLVGSGYYFWKTKMQQKTATGVINQMESVQGANPYDKTNPFSDIKVNPFE